MPYMQRALAVSAVLAVTAALPACGSSSSSSSAGGGGSTASSSTQSSGATTTSAASSVVTQAQAAVAKASAANTAFGGPASSPKPATGKTIYIVSCGPSEGCQRLSRGAMAAIQAIGWQGKVLKTDGSVQQFNSSMLLAIQQNASAILIDAFPSAAVAQPLAAAKTKGIPVISMVSGDPVPHTGTGFKGGLYTVVDANNNTMGKLAADYIIANADGKANVGTFTVSAFPVLALRDAGFVSEMKQCTTCKLNSPIALELTSLVQDGVPRTADFLRANPSVNYMFSTFDAGAVLAAQGIKTAASKAPLIGTEGNAPNLAMIRAGGPEIATVATPLEWVGWSAIDELNRAFAGQAPAPQWTPNGAGIPLKIVTKANIPPAGQSYTGDINYAAAYKKLWGR